MTQGVKDQPGQPITINSIELNPSLNDSEFEFPEVSETPETPETPETV
jgi:outer membrane lipoprotein-sorting protein